MYNKIEMLMKEKGVTPTDVSKATGIPRSNFTDWKKGRAKPKVDKLKLLSDYFQVPLETFTGKDVYEKFRITQQQVMGSVPYVSGYPVYYENPETAEAAQAAFERPGLRVLFDVAKDAQPKDIELAVEFLKRMKETNPDG